MRLANCQGAIGHLRALAAKLRHAIPALDELGATMGEGVRMCESACADLVEYISTRIIFYELEGDLVSRLYVPTPTAAGTRLEPCLLERLRPIVEQIEALAPREWRQPILESLLAASSRALGAALELSGR